MYICLERLGRLQEALPHLERFLDAVPENPVVLGLCAKHYVTTIIDVTKARHYTQRLDAVANGDPAILQQVKVIQDAINYLENAANAES